MDLALDPDHRHRLAADESGDRRSDGIGIQAPNGISNDCLKLERWRQGNGMAGLKGTLGIEGEQWYFPIGYRPEPGDRATFDGFWIVDCGHEDFHTEVHPPQVVVSSYMQTAPYLPALGATWNRPKVADRYVPETKGLVPATITKIVLTPVWEGPTAEIDVWPPPRPDAGARLHHTGGIDRSSGAVVVSEVPLPANNPNHLHVTLRRVQPYLANRSLVTGGINNPDGNFLFLASYMLWWKEN